MAFNIIAETDKEIDFDKLHNRIYTNNLNIEFVPMPKFGVNGGDAIGICIPLKNINEDIWAKLKLILKILRAEFDCDVYDLYGGQKLGLFNLNTFRKNLLGK